MLPLLSEVQPTSTMVSIGAFPHPTSGGSNEFMAVWSRRTRQSVFIDFHVCKNKDLKDKYEFGGCACAHSINCPRTISGVK